MEQAKMLFGLSADLRYKLKEIMTPDRRAPTGDWVLQMLEKYHEPDWEVCGVSPAGPRGIWIMYRRREP